MTLCPLDSRPIHIRLSLPELHVVRINPLNLKLADGLCDGLHIHRINSPANVEEAVVLNVETGADISDRDPDDVTLSAQLFAVLSTADERKAARESVREQIGFYTSIVTAGMSGTLVSTPIIGIIGFFGFVAEIHIGTLFISSRRLTFHPST